MVGRIQFKFEWKKAATAANMRGAIVVACGLVSGVLPGAQVPAKPTIPTKATIQGKSTKAFDAPALVDDYCVECHSDKAHKGGLSLESFDLAHPEKDAAEAEKIIRKLRAGMMPPAGRSRPADAQLDALAASIETGLDRVAATHPYAGFTPLHRLNRIEYANSVKALLDLDVNAEDLLPPDDLSHGFNNMADVLTVSPALLEAYISAAGKISREAIGDPHATPVMATYMIPRVISQTRRVEGAPWGTRGGAVIEHNFPADGDYVFKVAFYTHQMGYLFGQTQAKGQQLEISVNGERAAVVDVDPKFKDTDDVRTQPVHIKAGPQTISAAFIKSFDGPVQDEVQPYEQSLLDVNVASLPGLTTLPHLRGVSIIGPTHVTGVSETPSRDKIFIEYPARTADEPAAARAIVTNLVRKAYRKPAGTVDVDEALRYYSQQRAKGASFEDGIRVALESVLANPQFIFRFEKLPSYARPGRTYPIGDVELASRISYFLWSGPPDEELLETAAAGKLRDKLVLEHEVRRMLADKRAVTLSTNFAVQWLNLRNLDDVLPDPYAFPNFDKNLAQSMRHETELLFDDVVRKDRNVLDLLTSNYTFVDERLAKHYGIPNVLGNRFRRVAIPDDNRLGLLGQASILTLTSTANRTSPVARGKWVMQVLFGAPPPAPPPNVPPLIEAAEDSSPHSVRQKMEEHRKNPACASCHRVIDPIGFSLENYDPTGAWRNADSGIKIDTAGRLFDGTEINSPADLRNVVLKHKEAFLRNFAENLYAYGLGRIPDYRDLPEVRAIVSHAEMHDNRFSQYIVGIVESAAFTQRSAPVGAPSKPQASKVPLVADSGRRNRLDTLLKPGLSETSGGSR